MLFRETAYSRYHSSLWLPNGLNFLLNGNHSGPLVTVTLAFFSQRASFENVPGTHLDMDGFGFGEAFLVDAANNGFNSRLFYR